MLIAIPQVAGLREALNMKGHDYNTVLSVTTAGSVSYAATSLSEYADTITQNGHRPDSSWIDHSKD